ncbi:MAG: hypothetical protein KF878_34325 [Planctomycetes bacterium]|nr:hypothetical protein [Planctomycetota bacterium]
MRVALVAGLVLLSGCATSSPSRPRPEPLDTHGLANHGPHGRKASRIVIDVDDVDPAAVDARIGLWRRAIHQRLRPDLEALWSVADVEGTVALPDLARWITRRSGRTVLVDASAAHERVPLCSSVLCGCSP